MPDGTHAVMKKHPDNEANSYWIEVSGTPGGHGGPDRSAPTRKPWRRPVFDPATLKKLAKAIGSNGSDVVAEDDELVATDGRPGAPCVAKTAYTPRQGEIGKPIPTFPTFPNGRLYGPLPFSTVMHAHAGASGTVYGPPQGYNALSELSGLSGLFSRIHMAWSVYVRRPARCPQRPRIL